jgi:hypothetical protein
MSYSTVAKKVYGNKCELCGWGKATPDVHHIDYQEHWSFEKDLRKFHDNKEMDKFNELQKMALMSGYSMYNTDTRQLPKNDNPINLSVLCPNCHREVHHFDLGIKLLKSLPPRRELSQAMIKLLGG